MNRSVELTDTDHNLTAVQVGNTLTVVEGVVVAGLTNTVALVGAVGNVLTIVTLRLQGLDSSTNILLLSLAVADVLFLMTSWARSFSKYVQLYDATLAATVETYALGYAIVFNNLFLVISMTHIVIIAVERILAVFFPFQVTRWLTPRRMTMVSVGTHLVWYPIWTPLLFVSEIHWVFVPGLNQTIALISPTEFYTSNALPMNIFYKLFLMVFLGPFYSGVVLCCCLAIGVKLIRVTRKRLRMTEGQGKHGTARDRIHLRTVRMLVVVCVVYLMAGMPAAVIQLLETARPTLYVDERQGLYVGLLWCFNCSANFFIYVALSDKFKTTFHALCSCRRLRQHE